MINKARENLSSIFHKFGVKANVWEISFGIYLAINGFLFLIGHTQTEHNFIGLELPRLGKLISLIRSTKMATNKRRPIYYCKSFKTICFMNIIYYGYIYNNKYNRIIGGILLQFSSSSYIVY